MLAGYNVPLRFTATAHGTSEPKGNTTMTVSAATPDSVATTTSLLQAELPRLEDHQQTLEKELAKVTERLESVRSALTALQALSTAPPAPGAIAVGNETDTAPAPSASTEAELVTGPKATTERKPAPSDTASGTPETEAPAPESRKARKAAAAGGKSPAKQRKQQAAKSTTAKATKVTYAEKAAAAPPVETSGNLTEQVVAVVTAAGGKAVRARDVAEALGRELTASSINTVRSTLDRLVATSRAHRAGRGLYQAPPK